jgi:hypothetical protein
MDFSWFSFFIQPLLHQHAPIVQPKQGLRVLYEDTHKKLMIYRMDNQLNKTI